MLEDWLILILQKPRIARAEHAVNHQFISSSTSAGCPGAIGEPTRRARVKVKIDLHHLQAFSVFLWHCVLKMSYRPSLIAHSRTAPTEDLINFPTLNILSRLSLVRQCLAELACRFCTVIKRLQLDRAPTLSYAGLRLESQRLSF